jgi:hypothetical protein
VKENGVIVKRKILFKEFLVAGILDFVKDFISREILRYPKRNILKMNNQSRC